MRSIRTKPEPAARAAAAALGLAMSLGATSACTERLAQPIPAAHPDDPTPRSGGTLRLASYADVRGLDPAGPVDGLMAEAVHLIFSGLVDYDEDATIVPTSWPT